MSGTWLRIVCFLDYNDFFGYNFPIGDEIPDNVPRPALDTGEATRVILVKIHVTKIEYPDEEDAQSGAMPWYTSRDSPAHWMVPGTRMRIQTFEVNQTSMVIYQRRPGEPS